MIIIMYVILFIQYWFALYFHFNMYNVSFLYSFLDIQNMYVGHVIHFSVPHVMMVIEELKKWNVEIHQNIQHF